MDSAFGVVSGYVVSDEARQSADGFAGRTAGSSNPDSCPDSDAFSEESE